MGGNAALIRAIVLVEMTHVPEAEILPTPGRAIGVHRASLARECRTRRSSGSTGHRFAQTSMDLFANVPPSSAPIQPIAVHLTFLDWPEATISSNGAIP